MPTTSRGTIRAAHSRWSTAGRHGIPTPATHHIVGHYGDLARLDAALRGLGEFVVKAARGSGGSGIVLVTGRSADGFVKSSGDALSVEALRYHVSDILSGIHSLEGREDRAIVEALVHPDSLFAAVSYRGVPDLRVVVGGRHPGAALAGSAAHGGTGL